MSKAAVRHSLDRLSLASVLPVRCQFSGISSVLRSNIIVFMPLHHLHYSKVGNCCYHSTLRVDKNVRTQIRKVPVQFYVKVYLIYSSQLF